MVIDFSTINLKEQPMLVLRNLNGEAIQVLGSAFGVKAELAFNEISSISFSVPACTNNIETQGYNDIVGGRIVDMLGWGQFILTNPSIETDGVKEIKKCKANSLEYEFTYKKISLEKGTYNFWNPVTPNSSVLGIIISYMPSWSIGTVDSDLCGKYRTFSVENENIYNFIKSTIQKTYGCIFEFDTYNRKVNIRSINTICSKAPVYISLDNLAKSIEIEEDTENIFTVLDVNGADGVNIRSVNPMGVNKIYNLDYYMNAGYFNSDIIDKWNAWKTSYNNHQLNYYSITIQKMLKTTERISKENDINQIEKSELAVLENNQSVLIEYIATGVGKDRQNELDEVNNQIDSKRDQLSALKAELEVLVEEEKGFNEQLKAINNETAFSAYFSDDELLILDRYFKEDSIEDSSFVVSNAESYVDAGESHNISNTGLSFTDSNITQISSVINKELFSISGGTLKIGGFVDANIIKASIERKSDGSFVLAGYLGDGTINDVKFPSGCISITGTCSSISSDTTPDDEVGGAYNTGTSLHFDIITGKFYFTKNTTAYEKHSVEWDLYEYGKQCLEKLAFPSYSFDVSSVNFLALEDFEAFTQKLALGQKVYVSITEDNILEPIFTGLSVEFDNLKNLKLQFGDTYNISDSTFELVDLLEQSISMGKTVDTNRFSYNSFIDSGAATAVKDYMNSALDVAKNAILSGSNMAISWDSSGIHCRKWNTTGTGYEPEEIAIINNNIVFTDDGWQTAKMAIGHYQDTNFVTNDNLDGDVWGIIAPNIVGTLLAGENLVIESVKKDGGTAVFKVDANGAVLYNSKFELNTGKSHVLLDPTLGFGIGTYPVINSDNKWNTNNAKFWVDTDGNVHIKGILHGCDGTFSGELSAATGTFTGSIYANSGYFSGEVRGAKFTTGANDDMMDDDYKFTADYLNLKGITVKNSNGETTFSVDSNGNVTLLGENATLISPLIKTNDFTIESNEERFGGLSLKGKWYNSNKLTDMLKIYYYDTGAYPAVNFQSGEDIDAVAQWLFGQTYFHGNIDFTNAKVNGIHAVFA